MPAIVTLTVNPAVDSSAAVDFVVAERKLYCHSPRYDPGGGGINVARAIKRLGGEALAIHTAGGCTSELLRSLLDEEEVERRTVPIEERTRENIVILEEATGRQYRFNMPGPTLRREEWQALLDALTALEPAPEYLVASGSLAPGVPEDFYARVARIGRETGARTVLDTSNEPLRLGLREGVFLAKPNLREFSELVGVDFEDERRQEEAARALVREGQAEVLVISLGAAGVLVVSSEGSERLRAPTVPIRSKIGAGDSTVAGIVLKLQQGLPLREAVAFGVASGAAAVMTPGTELVRREDAEQLYRQYFSVRA